jgi:hypothetical protein
MRKLLVGVVALALGFACAVGPAHAGGAFSKKSFKGGYALVLSGTDESLSGVCPSPPCAAALTGQISTNGGGSITGGSVNLNVGGVSCSGEVTQGSYIVASDGTGSINTTINTNVTCTNSATFPIGSFNLSITLYNRGKQATLATLFTLPDGLVLAGTASSQNRIP